MEDIRLLLTALPPMDIANEWTKRLTKTIYTSEQNFIEELLIVSGRGNLSRRNPHDPIVRLDRAMGCGY